MTDADGNLFELMASLAVGDRGAASRLLAANPELAVADLTKGGERGGSPKFFLAELRHQTYAGHTALHVAAAAYDVEFARELLAAGAAIDAVNRRGARPLHYAVDGGPGSPRWDPPAQRSIVTFLVDSGADADHPDKNGTPPLLRAVRNRCTPAVEALLAAGANPRVTNAKGSTALQLAQWTTGRGGTGDVEARAEQEKIVRLLRASGLTT